MTPPTTFPITPGCVIPFPCWAWDDEVKQWEYKCYQTRTIYRDCYTHYSVSVIKPVGGPTLPPDQRPEDPTLPSNHKEVQHEHPLNDSPPVSSDPTLAATSLAEAVREAAESIADSYAGDPGRTLDEFRADAIAILTRQLSPLSTRLDATEANNGKLLLIACAWEEYANVSGDNAKAATARMCARQLREHLNQPPTQ